MHLAAYDQQALDLGSLTLTGRGGLGATRATVHAAWTWLAGSTYCPACLAETDGAWRLPWRVPWITASVTHAVNLRGTCPRCATLPGLGNQFNSTAPNRLYALRNAQQPGHGDRGDRPCPCNDRRTPSAGHVPR